VWGLALVLTWDGPSTIKPPLQHLQSCHPWMRPVRILRHAKVNKFTNSFAHSYLH
jgi:hypothetical protein